MQVEVQKVDRKLDGPESTYLTGHGETADSEWLPESSIVLIELAADSMTVVELESVVQLVIVQSAVIAEIGLVVVSCFSKDSYSRSKRASSDTSLARLENDAESYDLPFPPKGL